MQVDTWKVYVWIQVQMYTYLALNDSFSFVELETGRRRGVEAKNDPASGQTDRPRPWRSRRQETLLLTLLMFTRAERAGAHSCTNALSANRDNLEAYLAPAALALAMLAVPVPIAGGTRTIRVRSTNI